jgi:hypothetical protein
VSAHAILGPGTRPFSVLELRERTPGLTGAERLEVFHALPDPLQREAWVSLREHFDHVAELDFRDWCGDD